MHLIQTFSISLISTNLNQIAYEYFKNQQYDCIPLKSL